jgi:hypothetical protein
MSEQKLTVPPRSVFAALVLWAHRASSLQGDAATKLTNKLVELEDTANLDTGEISIRADRDGWISDDLASFLDRLVLFGLAREDPLTLLPKGLELCNEILAKDSGSYSSQIGRVKDALGLCNNRGGQERQTTSCATA